MKEFKMLNPKVTEIVEKLGQKAPTVIKMSDIDLQKTNEAIDNTIKKIKEELNITEKALSEVISAVKGEISRRGIEKKVSNQISMFDDLKKITDSK